MAGLGVGVLVVDPDRKRIVLTAKKTLVESTLPTIARIDDVKVGVVTHAVVFKVSDRSLQVEFYNGMKATVPMREARYLTLFQAEVRYSRALSQ